VLLQDEQTACHVSLKSQPESEIFNVMNANEEHHCDPDPHGDVCDVHEEVHAVTVAKEVSCHSKGDGADHVREGKGGVGWVKFDF